MFVLVGRVGEKSEGKEIRGRSKKDFQQPARKRRQQSVKKGALQRNSQLEICGQLVWVKGMPVVIAASCERASEAAAKEKEQK